MTTPEATFNPSPRQPTIRDMPTGERPRERLVEYGSKNLSNTELVAILLRTGSAGENVISLSSRLLTRFGGLAGLGKAVFAELCGEKGLSEAKACQLLAALELGRRFISLSSCPRYMTLSRWTAWQTLSRRPQPVGSIA